MVELRSIANEENTDWKGNVEKCRVAPLVSQGPGLSEGRNRLHKHIPVAQIY